jgi:hypothetical protein
VDCCIGFTFQHCFIERPNKCTGFAKLMDEFITDLVTGRFYDDLFN